MRSIRKTMGATKDWEEAASRQGSHWQASAAAQGSLAAGQKGETEELAASRQGSHWQASAIAQGSRWQARMRKEESDLSKPSWWLIEIPFVVSLSNHEPEALGQTQS